MTAVLPVGVIVGPTASGKSGLAEALVDRLNAEIVSADALQIYSGLDIGTAKPAPEAQRRYRYHGVDIAAPDDRFTAARFAEFAQRAFAEIRERDRLPLLVGGSGFYVDAALGALDPLPESQPAWRQVLERLWHERGAAWTHRWLTVLDPRRAARIEVSDRQRTLRALEIVLRTGRPVAEAVSERKSDAVAFAAIFVGLAWPRAQLHERIERRVDRMLAAGWLEEVRGLLAAGVPEDAHGMQAIGYRDLAQVVTGKLELAAARERIVRDTRRYAKRQITYFRRRPTDWLELGAGKASSDPDILQFAAAALTRRG